MELNEPSRTFISTLFLFFKILCNEDLRNSYIPNTPHNFLQTLLSFVSMAWNHVGKPARKPLEPEPETEEEPISRGDIDMVMDKLGIRKHEGDSSQVDDVIEGDEMISSIFDGEEVSLDELKAAFNVFDENRDGFIDGMELQSVLCKLGQKEKTELEACKKMIGGFDENGDGFIDFGEFVRLMESCSF